MLFLKMLVNKPLCSRAVPPVLYYFLLESVISVTILLGEEVLRERPHAVCFRVSMFSVLLSFYRPFPGLVINNRK